MTDRELMEQLAKEVADLKEEVQLISKVVTASRSDILSLCISKIAENGMVFDPKTRYTEEQQYSNEFLKKRGDVLDERIDNLLTRVMGLERSMGK